MKTSKRIGVWSVVLASLLAAVPLAACNAESAETGSTGRISLALSAQAGATAYRLQSATFTISDGPTSAQLTSSEDPAETSLTAELGVGSYQANLEPGWSLQQQQADGTYSFVVSKLVSPNPVAFLVNEDATTHLAYQFTTPGGPVTMTTGTLEVSVTVSETGTCSASCTPECAVQNVTSNCNAGFQAVAACGLFKESSCFANCECQ